MATAVYNGPADSLILPGDAKVYKQGDSISIDKATRKSLERAGHRFADSDEAEIAAEIAATPPAAPDTRPRDDRGAVMETKQPRAGREAAPARLADGPVEPAKS